MKMVIVEWIDSESFDEWEDQHGDDGDLPVIRSIGFLKSETDKYVTLVLSWDSTNEKVATKMKIPKVAIQAMRELK